MQDSAASLSSTSNEAALLPEPGEKHKLKRSQLSQSQEDLVDVSDDIEGQPGSSQISFTTPSFSVLEAENYLLKQEVEELRKKIENLSTKFLFAQIQDKDKLIVLYTGFPDKATFVAVFNYLNRQKFKYYLQWNVINISTLDQFFMTLIKLRLNLLHEDLGVRFSCSSATVTNIIMTWLHLMHECLFKKFLRHVPSRSKNKLCMPSSFSPFAHCKMVID